MFFSEVHLQHPLLRVFNLYIFFPVSMRKYMEKPLKRFYQSQFIVCTLHLESEKKKRKVARNAIFPHNLVKTYLPQLPTTKPPWQKPSKREKFALKEYQQKA